MKTKICTNCNKELEATNNNFYTQKKGKYGLKSICKSCSLIKSKEYRSTEEYKIKHREKMAKWRRENPKKALEVSRRSYLKNGNKYNEKRKEKYRTDPFFKEKVKERERKYKESGRRREVQSTPEQLEKARLRNKKRRECIKYRMKEYERNKIYREENKEKLHKTHIKNRKNLCPSYVAQSMRISVKDLTPEILETKRNIIKIKRELKNNNIKIR
jgi:hypothetical protein